MIRQIYLFAFLFIFVAAAPEASAQFLKNSDQIVQSLETAWDKEGGRPLQGPAEGLAVEKIDESRQNGAKGTEIILQVFYPQGTGNAQVDKAVKEFADEALDSYRKDAEEFLNEDQPAPGPGLLSRTFALTQPSPDYISVIFFESTYLGGAHPSRSYDILSFDLKNGRRLSVDDLFPKGEDDEQNRALGFLANYANAALDHKCLKNYKDNFCRPNSVTGDSVSHSLRNFALTPDGLAVVYGPYDQGAYAEGSKYLDIPKAELISWGAPDIFWSK